MEENLATLNLIEIGSYSLSWILTDGLNRRIWSVWSFAPNSHFVKWDFLVLLLALQ